MIFLKYHFWFVLMLFFSSWASRVPAMDVARSPKATGQLSVKIYQYRHFCFILICHLNVLKLAFLKSGGCENLIILMNSLVKLEHTGQCAVKD